MEIKTTYAELQDFRAEMMAEGVTSLVAELHHIIINPDWTVDKLYEEILETKPFGQTMSHIDDVLLKLLKHFKKLEKF